MAEPAAPPSIAGCGPAFYAYSIVYKIVNNRFLHYHRCGARCPGPGSAAVARSKGGARGNPRPGMSANRPTRRHSATPGHALAAKGRSGAVPFGPRLREHTIAEAIATSLEEDIVLGRRHPRERLVEQDLCDRFKTHRGDVRLALFELEKKGIVQRIPNRGAIVRDLTPREVMEIYAVRGEVEVMAVRILPFPVAATH